MSRANHHDYALDCAHWEGYFPPTWESVHIYLEYLPAYGTQSWEMHIKRTDEPAESMQDVLLDSDLEFLNPSLYKAICERNEQAWRDHEEYLADAGPDPDAGRD